MTDIITQLRREGDMPVPNVLVIREAADEFARMARRYSEEHFTVCRVWKALGIDTYEQANGKAIDELVADLRAEIESLRRENAALRNTVITDSQGNTFTINRPISDKE